MAHEGVGEPVRPAVGWGGASWGEDEKVTHWLGPCHTAMTGRIHVKQEIEAGREVDETNVHCTKDINIISC